MQSGPARAAVPAACCDCVNLLTMSGVLGSAGGRRRGPRFAHAGEQRRQGCRDRDRLLGDLLSHNRLHWLLPNALLTCLRLNRRPFAISDEFQKTQTDPRPPWPLEGARGRLRSGGKSVATHGEPVHATATTTIAI